MGHLQQRGWRERTRICQAPRAGRARTGPQGVHAGPSGNCASVGHGKKSGTGGPMEATGQGMGRVDCKSRGGRSWRRAASGVCSAGEARLFPLAKPSQQLQSQTSLQSSNACTAQCRGSAEVHRAHTTGIYIPQVVHGRCPRPPARTRRVHMSLRLGTMAKAMTMAGLAHARQVPFWSQQWDHRSVWCCRTVCKPASPSSSVRSVWDEPPAVAGQHRSRASTLSHQESAAAPRRVLRGSPC